MRRQTNQAITSNAAVIAQKLRAHARLCEQVAQETWSEEAAATLRRMAGNCDRVAEQLADKMTDTASATRH
jgi:hypothetical protein